MGGDHYVLARFQLVAYAVDQYFSNAFDDLDERSKWRYLSHYDLTDIKRNNTYIARYFSDDGFGYHGMLNIFNAVGHGEDLRCFKRRIFQ